MCDWSVQDNDRQAYRESVGSATQVSADTDRESVGSVSLFGADTDRESVGSV